MEAHLIRTSHFTGITCTVYQRRDVPAVSQGMEMPESVHEQQLRFRCSTGSHNTSLNNFPLKVRHRHRLACPGSFANVCLTFKYVLFFIPGRIPWPWPQWLFQTPCLLLTLLRTVSCSLLHTEPAAFSLCLGTQATPGNTLADVASTRLSCSSASVSSRCNVFGNSNIFFKCKWTARKKLHLALKGPFCFPSSSFLLHHQALFKIIFQQCVATVIFADLLLLHHTDLKKNKYGWQLYVTDKFSWLRLWFSHFTEEVLKVKVGCWESYKLFKRKSQI